MNDWINKVHCGDCLEVMKEMPDNSIDSCVTDPPYGLEFMGKEWDKIKLPKGMITPKSDKSIFQGKAMPRLHQASDHPYLMQEWHQVWASELLRILKPGAYLLAFGGTRTEHRLSCGIEDAGFVIRDKIAWFYGSGFPKNKDVSKGFDKAAGAEREIISEKVNRSTFDLGQEGGGGFQRGTIVNSKPSSPLAKQWSGWGTALKPSFEFIILAQKPLDKNYCHNLEKWGCGAMNIDGGRIGIDLNDQNQRKPSVSYNSKGSIFKGTGKRDCENLNSQGRWPANLILECTCEKVIPGKAGETIQGIRKGGIWKTGGKETPMDIVKGDTPDYHTDPNCPCRLLDEESGELTSGKLLSHHQRTGDGLLKSNTFKIRDRTGEYCNFGGDSGGASRFFKYIPKADRAEKEAGLRGRLPCVKCGGLNSDTHLNDNGQRVNCVRNDHPTVKPIALFRYLQMMFTPPGGITIDPFAGSGSSCISAIREDFNYIAIDQDEGYIKIAEARITEETKQLKLF